MNELGSRLPYLLGLLAPAFQYLELSAVAPIVESWGSSCFLYNQDPKSLAIYISLICIHPSMCAHFVASILGQLEFFSPPQGRFSA